MQNASLVHELYLFMSTEKKWWLGPLALVLGVFSTALVVAEGSAFAPFIYTIF